VRTLFDCSSNSPGGRRLPFRSALYGLQTMDVAHQQVPTTKDEEPRKSRTPEERPIRLCPNCFLAVPAATGRCEYCE
jgi:hypothetical protein